MPSDPIPISSTTVPPSQPLLGSVGLTTATNSALFSKWSPFAPLKSPSSTATSVHVRPADPASPPAKSYDSSALADDDTHGEHDSFEFGDITDLKSRGWAAAAAASRGQRRAVSMSVSPVIGAGMISPFPDSASSVPPALPSAVMNDKMARGAGVLRRLSLGGGFTRPNMAPPGPLPPSPPNPTPSGPFPAQEPTLATVPPPVEKPIGSGRRRYSESGGRRRGVSPMGERILRDQVHF